MLSTVVNNYKHNVEIVLEFGFVTHGAMSSLLCGPVISLSSKGLDRGAGRAIHGVLGREALRSRFGLKEWLSVRIGQMGYLPLWLNLSYIY